MKKITVAAASVALAFSSTSVLADTLDDVKAKGHIQCGVSQGLPGFSNPNSVGDWTGMDVDFCRALSAAIFGSADNVKYTPLTAKERFTALQSGEIDVLSRNTTWTATRDTQLGLNFAGVLYYDGQGFMVRQSLKVASALELSGAAVCVQTGTTTELNLADFFSANGMQYEPVAFENNPEVIKAYDTGRCDVLSTDASGLYAERIKMTNPDEHIVLPEIISKEPLGPVVRQGDDGWFNVNKWTLFAMLNAEELGVNSKNVDEMKGSKNPEIKRLLGIEGNFGEEMGLTNDWAYNIVKNVGNYSEIFEKNVGPDTPLNISRGVNALWKDGGVQYAPPIR